MSSNTVTPASVTSADVARKAGVSRSTVSRCFKADSRISKETRERVLKIADELGYQVNKIARSMITRKSDLVGLVISGLHDPFRASLVDHLVREIQNLKLHPLIIDVTNNPHLEESIRKLAQYQVCGIVITSGTPSPEIGAAFLKQRTPVVMINRAGQLDGASLVNCDNESGARLAAEAFLARGITRLGYVMHKAGTYSGKARWQAFQEALRPRIETGEVALELICCETPDYQGGYDAALAALVGPERPRGVFCATDHIACGLMDAARRELGLRIPEDLGVIGFDDIPLAAHKAYDLTTLRQSPADMARSTAMCLLDSLERNTANHRVETPVELILRNSLAEQH